MQTLQLNEIPVRTSKNFNINNIKLENIKFPKNIKEFNNININGNISKISIDNNVNSFNLSYGIGDTLIEQVKDNSNVKLSMNCPCTSACIHEEMKIDFIINKDNPTLIENIEIIANQNSKSTIILKYETIQDLEFWHNGIIRVNAKKDSEINIILVNLMNTKSNNFISIENTIGENAKVKYTIIDFGGKNSITNYYSNINGDNASNIINTIYLGKENQLFDINYIGELKGKKSNIDIEVQGVLKDIAKKHFKGTIDFKKGCKKAKGNENESCMLLSDTAKSIALPLLLCSEEDIEGNHSTSTGKFGKKELFYIMSRGFSLKEAMKLMVKARFNNILENISDVNLKEDITNEIDKRLD